jgi:hypothetical protein
MSDCSGVRRALAKHGLLLLQDKVALDIVSMLAGEKLSTSWWGHAAGQAIFACLERLDDDPDVLSVRLVAGKITYVHRDLWPAFLAVATSHEEWQTQGLSVEARELLDAVRRTDTRAIGRAAKELQERLLVHAKQVHTESGKHELVLQAWSRVVKMRGVVPATDNAKVRIEAAVEAIGAPVTALPWLRKGRRPAAALAASPLPRRGS